MINKNKIASRNSHGFRMTLLPFDAEGSQRTSSEDAIITLLLSARPVTRKEGLIAVAYKFYDYYRPIIIA